jgi:protein-disulfide isomerase
MQMNRMILGLAVAIGLMGSAYAAATADVSAEQRQAFEAIIRDYLVTHPEVIREALQELERRQAVEAQTATKKKIGERAKEIYRASGDLVLGNPKGKITVVEFFDYNCGYCKKAIPEVEKLIRSDKDVRVVIKEFPILGPGSVFAAKAALASRSQGKYNEFHLALTKLDGVKDETSVMQVAEQVGLDLEKLKTDMESEGVSEVIGRNYSLAESLAINGTPSFIIDETLEPGYVTYDVLAGHVSTVRQNGGCRVC